MHVDRKFKDELEAKWNRYRCVPLSRSGQFTTKFQGPIEAPDIIETGFGLGLVNVARE
jgi:hypothetical protein